MSLIVQTLGLMDSDDPYQAAQDFISMIRTSDNIAVSIHDPRTGDVMTVEYEVIELVDDKGYPTGEIEFS